MNQEVAHHGGSSPLARGTRTGLQGYALLVRFIPARAGNTLARRRSSVRRAVHPRSRGEHTVADYVGRARDGSSPLARGTRRSGTRSRRPGRFIPARAGNTSRAGSPARARPVHPRSRGEHPSAGGHAPASSGSSPLARGTREYGCTRRIGNRFIPARAGNTPLRASNGDTSTVHPRSRGEHYPGVRGRKDQYGSSPLARGTLDDGNGMRLRHRFIPARAGNTPVRVGCLSLPSVHPRSRGEHALGGGETQAHLGSSPLARGTRAGGLGFLGN